MWQSDNKRAASRPGWYRMKIETTTKWKMTQLYHYNSGNNTLINTYICTNLAKQANGNEQRHGVKHVFVLCARTRELEKRAEARNTNAVAAHWTARAFYK